MYLRRTVLIGGTVSTVRYKTFEFILVILYTYHMSSFMPYFFLHECVQNWIDARICVCQASRYEVGSLKNE